MKKKLQILLDDGSSWQGKLFSTIIQSLIIISIIAFTVETLPNLDENEIFILNLIEYICITVFTVEYVLRVYVAERKVQFVFSFFGLIDLLAILPFYITVGIDLRSLRVFRLLRLFRILKLMRYNKAANKFLAALKLAKEELVLFFFVTVILLYLGAVGIYYFENEAQPDKFSSVFHSLWWAVATLTTVGYGDVYPITLGGRIFTFIILLIGLSVIAIPAGIISSALTNSVTNKEE